MKTKRFSLGIKIASILSAVAILSVGFASWLIVNVPEAEPQTVGSFTVHEVVEKNVTLAYDWGNDNSGANLSDEVNGAINFGMSTANATYNPVWFKPENIEAEKLTAEVAISITNFDALSKINVALDTGVLADLVDNGTVAAPTITVYNKGKTQTLATGTGNVDVTGLTADSASGNVCTVVVVFTFGWGSHFTLEDAVVNPYDYYNSQEKTEALVTDAKNTLNPLFALNGETYDVTITCTSK